MATFRVYSKDYPELSLNVTANKGINLAKSNPKDPNQQWYVKPAKKGIALVNKATNLAIEHVGYDERVQLAHFNPVRVPDSQKWNKGHVVVGNYYQIRAHNDRELALDAVKPNSIKTSNWDAAYSQLWIARCIRHPQGHKNLVGFEGQMQGDEDLVDFLGQTRGDGELVDFLGQMQGDGDLVDKALPLREASFHSPINMCGYLC